MLAIAGATLLANQISISGAIDRFYKFEILRSFWKAFQYSKCSKGCQKLVIWKRYLQRKERSLVTLETHFLRLIPFNPPSDFVSLLLPWLIRQTKLARLLEVSCKIKHYSCRKLQESCKKCKKCSLGRFWQNTSDLSVHFLSKCLLSRSDVSLQNSFKKLARFFRICKITPLL